MSTENKLIFNISNISYSFVEQQNLSFTCSIQTSLMTLYSINPQSYEFSNSPHSIWPRPYLKGDFQSCRSPQASFIAGVSNLTYNINDSSENIILNLCEHCQGFPINQTKILSISPNVDSSFLNFFPNGQLEILMNEVINAGYYMITIQNQIKLLNPNMTNYRIIDYIWDDPINLSIELINNFPKITTNLTSFTIIVNTELSFNILFLDDEGDQVYLSLNSTISTIESTYSSVQTQNNNFTISWTPNDNDIGVNNVTLNYWDRLHQSNLMSLYFAINVINFINPYFESAPSNVTVFSGESTTINLPSIINPSNAIFSLSIQIEDHNSNRIDASDWLIFNQQILTVFPK